MSNNDEKKQSAPSGPAPATKNYAVAAGARAPQPTQPTPTRPGAAPGFLPSNVGGAPAVAPPLRTASAPPEQQNMQGHLKASPAFIPDKSTAPRTVVAPAGAPPPLAANAPTRQFQQGQPFPPPYSQPGFRPQGPYPPGPFVQPPYAFIGTAQPFVPPPFAATPAPPPVKQKSAALSFTDPLTNQPLKLKTPLKMGATFEPKSGASATAVPPPAAGVVAPAGSLVTGPAAAAPGATSGATSGAAAAAAAAPTAAAATAAAPATTVVAVAGGVAAATTTAPSSSPSVVGPASDAKSTNTGGLITKQGRWKPPVEDTPNQAPSKDHISLPAVAAVVVAASPAVAPPAESKPAEAKPVAESVKVAEETKPAVVVAEPKVEAKVEPKVEPQKTEVKPEPAKTEEKPAAEQAKEEWELVNAAELSREVEQRVAASQLVVEKEPVAAPLPKKIEAIRYDDVSYNPLEEKEGKKKYSKEFLMQFRPYFTERPADLDDLDIVDGSDGGNNNNSGGGRGGRENSRDRSPTRGGRGGRDRNSVGSSRAAEQWEKGREGGQGGGGREPGGRYDRGRGSGKDRYGKKEPPKPTGPPVEPLQRSESGWKPEKIDTSTEDGLKLALVKEAQGHLNKMTQVTYEKLSTRIIAIANKEQGPPPLPGLLREIINKVFEQALQQPTFCAMYAMLCAKISRSTKDFRRELLNKCQEEFESDAVEPPADLSQAEQDMMRFKAKKRMLGNIKFICELYKQKMLMEEIMHSCISRLLKQDLLNPDEEQTEALCDFLVRIGKLLDRPGAERLIEGYFNKLDQMKSGPNIGARLRFMVEDVCDFRASGWKPGKSGPKAVLRAAKSAKEPKNEEEKGAEKGGKSPAKGASAGAATAGGAARGQKPDSQWKEVSKAPKGGQGGQGGQGGNAGKGGGKDSPGTKDRKERGGKDSSKRQSGGTPGKDEGGRRNDRGGRGGQGGGGRNSDKNSGSPVVSKASPAAVPAKKEPSTPVRADDDEEEGVKPDTAEKSSNSNERYIPAVHSAIDEYWELNDIEGVTYAIEKDFPEDYRSQFIYEAFKHSMMRSDKERERLLDCIFSPELTDGLFSKAVLRAGVQLVVDALADLQMDHPAAPRKFAPFVARSINEGVHSFKDLWSLFDQHIEEGRGYGVCGEALGATLKCLSQSSSIEKIKELLATNHFSSIVAKLPPQSRTNEATYAKFLAEFGLGDCFPALDKSVKTPPVGNSPVAVAKGSGTFEFKKADEALDELGLAVLQALRKGSMANALLELIQKHVGGPDELVGNFKVAKSVFRACLEYWLVALPAAGAEKVVGADTVKTEAKMVKLAFQPVLDAFNGSDKAEVGETILDVYGEFLEFHGKEVNSAFYMRGLQYFHAYKFVSTAILQEFGNKGQGILNQSCKRVGERILSGAK